MLATLEQNKTYLDIATRKGWTYTANSYVICFRKGCPSTCLSQTVSLTYWSPEEEKRTENSREEQTLTKESVGDLKK